MRLTAEKVDKLSELLLKVAEGLFLAALAAPAVSSTVTAITSIKILLTAFLTTYFSLKILDFKEVTS